MTTVLPYISGIKSMSKMPMYLLKSDKVAGNIGLLASDNGRSLQEVATLADLNILGKMTLVTESPFLKRDNFNKISRGNKYKTSVLYL